MQRMRETPGSQRPSREVLMNILLVVTASVVSLTAGSSMEIYPGMRLGTAAITAVKRDAPSMCYCRMYCMAQLNCTSVTIEETKTGLFDCFFSDKAFLKTSLELLTTSLTIGRPGCSPNFILVHGVGCLILVREMKTFADAESACKVMDAELYDAPSQEQFDLFRYELVRRSVVGEFWVGAKDRQWTRSGRAPDASEWAAKEPNDPPSFCVRVTPLEAFKLRDKNCSLPYNYICQNVWV